MLFQAFNPCDFAKQSPDPDPAKQIWRAFASLFRIRRLEKKKNKKSVDVKINNRRQPRAGRWGNPRISTAHSLLRLLGYFLSIILLWHPLEWKWFPGEARILTVSWLFLISNKKNSLKWFGGSESIQRNGKSGEEKIFVCTRSTYFKKVHGTKILWIYRAIISISTAFLREHSTSIQSTPDSPSTQNTESIMELIEMWTPHTHTNESAVWESKGGVEIKSGLVGYPFSRVEKRQAALLLLLLLPMLLAGRSNGGRSSTLRSVGDQLDGLGPLMHFLSADHLSPAFCSTASGRLMEEWRRGGRTQKIHRNSTKIKGG